MEKYTPTPIDTTDVQLPRDLYTLMEELSRSNHDTWSLHRFEEGWIYGETRDDENKKHPDLVPYNELTEKEKNYDRNTSMETLKSIYKLGFAITKRKSGNIMVVGSYNDDIQKSLLAEAQKYELSLVFYSDWNSACTDLKHDLSKWNSIVLDTEAKLKANEDRTQYFLRNVLDDLTAIFSRNRNEVPWFILPNEYNDFTDALIKFTVGRERENKDWGAVLYKIDDFGKELFYNIAEILPNTRNYRIKCVYDEVFEVLENIYPERTKSILLNILLPLHYPEVFYSFAPTDYYNGLRRVLESTFEVFYNYGLIPGDVFYNDKNGSINLRNSCNYLIYKDIKVDSSKYGRGICPSSICGIVESILNISNEGSHMGEEYKTEGLYFSIMSYSLQLCDVILWLGKYININKLQPFEQMFSYYEGNEFEVEMDQFGYFYCGRCVLPRIPTLSIGQKVILTDVQRNTGMTKQLYPLFARFRPKS